MVKYHPDARFLTDYTAGSLPRSQALCVSTHLHYCQSCRIKTRELTELGAELFMHQQPAPITEDAFSLLLGWIENQPEPAAIEVTHKPLPAGNADLPHAINKLTRGNVENLRWRKVGNGFRFTDLDLGDQRETSLLQIKAGSSVPHHRHKGDEITVILKGSFSDHDDKYSVGDFIVRTSGEAHRPVASQDEDCLCLATLDAPLEMSNWFYRMLMPLVSGGRLQMR